MFDFTNIFTDEISLKRNLCLLLPSSIVLILLALRRPNKKIRVGAFLASLWVLASLVIFQVLVNYFDWWSFYVKGGILFNIPVDLLVGWMLLWGVIPIFTSLYLRLPIWFILMLVFDLVLMPLLFPLLKLNQNWIIGEVLALFFCFIPAQLLARWTIEERHLQTRAFLQVICFSILFLFVIPLTVFEQTSNGWQVLFLRPKWLNSLYLQLLAIPMVLGLSAVQEFAESGKGTPFPYDPPKKLVTSSLYAYVSNPMQLSMVLIFFGYGLILNHFWLFFSGIVAFSYSVGLARWDEDQELEIRFGQEWLDYRKNVRAWLPSWRPWHISLNNKNISPARLYYDEGCSQCSDLAEWFKKRDPIGMILIPAQDHPTQDLKRLTYDPMNGNADKLGVCAFAKALEHINLAWALIGCFMRLPLIHQFLQLVSDLTDGEARQVCRRTKTLSNTTDIDN
jgi:protein-S-isoprenylcysteine O-methyltransferase Ste14